MKDLILVNIVKDHTWECSDNIIGRTGEGDISVFKILLTEENMSNYSIYLEFKKSNGERFRSLPLTVVNNMAFYQIPKYLLAESGRLQVQLILEKDESKLWASTVKTYYVLESISGMEQIPEIESDVYIPTADDLTYGNPIVYYTVTFKDYNGKILKTEIVEEGKSATAPNNPNRVNYAFIGWDKTFTNITSDLIVTAQYEHIINTVIGTTWKIDEIPIVSTFYDWRVNFTCDGTNYTNIKIDDYDASISYDNNTFIYEEGNGEESWASEKYRYITITGGQDVTNPEFIAWLQGNATQGTSYTFNDGEISAMPTEGGSTVELDFLSNDKYYKSMECYNEEGNIYLYYVDLQGQLLVYGGSGWDSKYQTITIFDTSLINSEWLTWLTRNTK